MKKAVVTASILAFLLFGYMGLATYAISTQGIEQLLLCADRGGLKIPFSKQLCRGYLLAFRGSREDIDTLHKGVGALFVTQGESATSERAELLNFLVGKGLDVNRVDMHQLLPLHGATLANSADEVKILLDNGADPSLTDGRFGLTPLEFALKLRREDKSNTDREAVIALLRNADSNAQPILLPDAAR
jgi:hypothetical protein